MSNNQNMSINGPGHIRSLNDFEEHWGRKESSEKSAVAEGCSIAVQRDVLGDYTLTLHALRYVFSCVCVFTCWSMWTYLKRAAPGTLGFISSSCVISMPAFQMVQQVT